MLSDEEIIQIAADTKTGEPGLHGYTLPISFAREVERAVLAKVSQRVSHEFKNFHRLLCERFDYCHDPVDWTRDQISLIEHIAANAMPAHKQEPVAYAEYQGCLSGVHVRMLANAPKEFTGYLYVAPHKVAPKP